MLTHKSSKVHTEEDKTHVFQLLDAGHSQGEVSRHTGIPQPTISRWVKARPHPAVTPEPSNGHLPAILPSQPIAVLSQSIAVPSQPIAMAVDDLQSRVATLEAFMAVVQAEHRSGSQPIAMASQPIAVHRHEPPTWLSRGLQVAADMVDAMDAYAAQHRLEKREVLDLALRTFFAQVGQEVGNER